MFGFRNFIHKINNNIIEEIEPVLKSVGVSTTTYIEEEATSLCYGITSYSTKYFLTNSGLDYPSVGEVLYNDMALTSPFNGGGAFYKISWAGATGSTEINSSGQLALAISICIQTLSLRYSNIDGTTACSAIPTTYYTDDIGANLYTDMAMTVVAPSGYYAGFVAVGGMINNQWREWNGTSYTSSGTC